MMKKMKNKELPQPSRKSMSIYQKNPDVLLSYFSFLSFFPLYSSMDQVHPKLSEYLHAYRSRALYRVYRDFENR